jgi:hypothetical protein
VALNPQQMQWKGRMIINLRPADRWLAPWEHEAKRMGSQIARLSKEPKKATFTASRKRP